MKLNKAKVNIIKFWLEKVTSGNLKESAIAEKAHFTLANTHLWTNRLNQVGRFACLALSGLPYLLSEDD